MNFITKTIYALIAWTACCQANQEPFVVGTTSGYAPYVSLTLKGEYEGFDIDVSNLIAERLNRKLVLKDLGSMTSLLMALQRNKIDALIWAVSITEERQKAMNMIYYQGEKVTQMPFVFWKEIPQDITKIEDFSNHPNQVICVETGSYQNAVLEKYPKLALRNLEKILDGIMELKYKKCLSVAVDYSLLDRMKKQYPELKTLNLPLPPSQQSHGYGICIAKSNEKLTAQITKIIHDLQEEGKLAELEKKWGLSSH